MKRQTALLAVALVLASLAFAAASPWLDDDKSEEQMVDQLSRAVVWLHNRTTGATATGVLLLLELDGTSKAILATNFHVLSSTDSKVDLWIFGDQGKPVRESAGLWAAEPKADLALFDLRVDDPHGVWSDKGVLTIAKGNRAIEEGNVSDGSEIRRGRSVIFLGFPLNNGIRVEIDARGEPNLLEKVPVLKHGTVALEASPDWILVDGMNNHGNSGSPVFARAETPQGDPTFKLIGIMSGFENDSAGEIIFPDGRHAPIPHNSGLARVVSIKAIRRLFQERMKLEISDTKRRR